ncbi:MAG: transcriptional repressor [Spirochaetes bacterium]|nr:transcriptional repressor [Spirochaetota bacterium]
MDVTVRDIDGIKRYLMNEGINPSYQRIKIFEYLANHRIHPTVDTIYNDLCREIPTLSKTTIYNTLNLFEQKEIITSLSIEKNELRYECDTRPHAHFKCTVCGTVYDIRHEFPLVTKSVIDGHKVTEQQLYLKGICKNCSRDS